MKNDRDKNEIEHEFKEIETFLNQIPQYMPLSGVERTRILLDALDHPEKDLQIIHVAGTNGKGSVCAFLNEILCEQGYKTGLFTSPHLVDIRERIRIGHDMVSKEQLVKAYRRIQQAARLMKEQAGVEPAYFDYFLGMALCIYQEQHVDYMIMETGLGGRLDATNAIAQPILSVITTISLEHTAILGDTLSQIATEKAGIIKKQIPVVYLDKCREVGSVIKNVADTIGTRAVPVTPDQYQILKNSGKYIDFSVENEYYKNDCFKLANPAEYQVENSTLALTAVKVLETCGRLKLEQEKIHQAVWNTHWAGRMEEILPDVYLDGAHNPEGIEAFLKAAASICQGRTCSLLFSVVRDKNYQNMIQRLCDSGLFASIILTQVGGSRSLEGNTLKDQFLEDTNVPVTEFDQVKDAFTFARQQKADVLLCAGSLYLVGEIKALLMAEKSE